MMGKIFMHTRPLRFRLLFPTWHHFRSLACRRFHSDRHLEIGVASPYDFYPWNAVATSSPFAKSPCDFLPILSDDLSGTGLVGTLVREEGHIYSLAAAGDLLYIGSDSKNIRVWKGCREISGFRSSSVGPSNYERVRRHRKALWVKHFDAVSCLALDTEAGIIPVFVVVSGSADRTLCVRQREEGIGKHTKLAVLVRHEGPVKSVVVVVKEEEEEEESECSWAGGEPSLERRYVVYSGSLDRSIKV